MNQKVAEIQAILGVTADGIFGPKSRAALEDLLRSLAANAVDDRSETNISTLHRTVQPLARRLVNSAAENGIRIEVTSGTRTYTEQDRLFAKGGVTKARGGQSSHNFGLAFDVTMFDGKTPIYESPQYATLGLLGKRIGLVWGGDWETFTDEPHFEKHPDWAIGMTESNMMAELRARHNQGIDVFA